MVKQDYLLYPGLSQTSLVSANEKSFINKRRSKMNQQTAGFIGTFNRFYAREGFDIKIDYANYDYYIPYCISKHSRDITKDVSRSIFELVNSLVDEWLKDNVPKTPSNMSLSSCLFSLSSKLLDKKFTNSISENLLERGNVINFEIHILSLTLEFERLGDAIGVRIEKSQQNKHNSGKIALESICKAPNERLRKTIRSFEVTLPSIGSGEVNMADYFSSLCKYTATLQWNFSKPVQQELMLAYEKGERNRTNVGNFHGFCLLGKYVHHEHKGQSEEMQRNFSSSQWRMGNIKKIHEVGDGFNASFSSDTDINFSFGLFPPVLTNFLEDIDKDYEFSGEQERLEDCIAEILLSVQAYLGHCFLSRQI